MKAVDANKRNRRRKMKEIMKREKLKTEVDTRWETLAQSKKKKRNKCIGK